MITQKTLDDILEKEINWHDLIENVPLLIAVADNKGYLIRVNSYWEQVTGYTPKEISGEPFINFLHPDDVSKSMKHYLEGATFNKDAEEFYGFENRYRRKSGGWVKLEWYSTGNRVDGLNIAVAIPREITE